MLYMYMYIHGQYRYIPTAVIAKTNYRSIKIHTYCSNSENQLQINCSIVNTALRVLGSLQKLQTLYIAYIIHALYKAVLEVWPLL